MIRPDTKYVLAIQPDEADRADTAIASTAQNGLNYMNILKLQDTPNASSRYYLSRRLPLL